MKNEPIIHVSREKHLDHMVKVVPFIVFCYAVQSFLVMKINPGPFSSVSLSVLGGILAMMIAGFIVYDLKHKVEFTETEIKIKFLFFKNAILYTDLWEVIISEPGQSFSHLTLKTKNRKHTFYFIDDGEKIKSWIEEKRQIKLNAA